MKKLLIMCLMLCIGSALFANDSIVDNIDGMFAGAGAEVNANSREGVALGGVLSFGVDFFQQFAGGLKLTFSHNLDETSALEPQAFFRFYLPLQFETGDFFVQADMGAVVLFEDGSAYPSFSGGLTAGWRYVIVQNIYIEPHLRVGYPFIWGAGISAGMKIPINTGSANKGGDE